MADDDEVSCEGEDERLAEFRGNVEVVLLHRQLEEAKSKAREGNGNIADDSRDKRAARHGGEQLAEEKLEMHLYGLNFEGDDFGDEDLVAPGIGLHEAVARPKRPRRPSWHIGFKHRRRSA